VRAHALPEGKCWPRKRGGSTKPPSGPTLPPPAVSTGPATACAARPIPIPSQTAIIELKEACCRPRGESFPPTSRTPWLPRAHRPGEEAWNTAGLGHFSVRCVLWDAKQCVSHRLIFFDCFSKRAHLRRPGRANPLDPSADQGSVERQDHGRESGVSRHARAGPHARRAGAFARVRAHALPEGKCWPIAGSSPRAMNSRRERRSPSGHAPRCRGGCTRCCTPCTAGPADSASSWRPREQVSHRRRMPLAAASGVNAAGIEHLSNAGKTHRPHNGRSDFAAGTALHAPFPTFAPMVSNGSLGWISAVPDRRPGRRRTGGLRAGG